MLKASVQRVVDALAAEGIVAPIHEFDQSTRTAEQAAAAVGTSVGQIVKSLIFLAGGQPILALVSGENRAEPTKLAALAGAPIERASADVVRAATGFAIGGVAPVGHTAALTTYLDHDLMRYDLVWAAAGTPNTVFNITPADLQRITGARVVDLAAE